MTKTTTFDITATIVDAGNAAKLDVGTIEKRLSQNKYRLTVSAYQYGNLVEAATRALDVGSGDARHNRNMKQAGEAALRVLNAEGNKPAATNTPKKPKPAPIDPKDRPDPTIKGDPSKATYDALTTAFEVFNATLFHGKLPPVMLVIHRKRNAHGYFWKGMWANAQDKDAKLSEIALNPESMGRTPKEVLSTLAHEMVHHEQHVFGKPSKSGHNVEWGEWMARIGLTPIGVGNCAGKKSGRNFTHEIVEGGDFDKIADKFLARPDVDMSWFSPRRGGGKKKQDFTKVKHTCGCGDNMWGKHNPDDEDGKNLVVDCGKCGTAFEPVFYA